MLKISMGKYDRIWGKMVRERDGKCRNCGKKPPYVLQAHHVMPRSRRATRFVLENGITLCSHCHVLGDKSAHRIGKQFCIDLLGLEEYKRLEKMSLQTKPQSQAIIEFKAFIDSVDKSI